MERRSIIEVEGPPRHGGNEPSPYQRDGTTFPHPGGENPQLECTCGHPLLAHLVHVDDSPCQLRGCHCTKFTPEIAITRQEFIELMIAFTT